MNGKTEDTQTPLDISFLTAKYLTPVLERKWLVIYFFIAGTILSLVVSLFIKPEFYSIGSLLVQEPRSKISGGTRTNPLDPRAATQTYVLSEAESLKSIPFVTEVLKILPEKVKMDLDVKMDPFDQVVTGLKDVVKKSLGLKRLRPSNEPEGRKSIPVSPLELRKERIAGLKSRVIIKSKSKNAMIWITARSLNRYVAPILVKSYISVWMAKNLEDNRKAISIEKKFALEQRNTAGKLLNEASKKLMDFRNHYEIPSYFGPEEGLGDMELQSQFEQLQTQVNGAAERFEYLDKVFLKMQMEEAGIAENIKVLDAPTSPGAPSKTKRQEILLMGILGGLGVGIGIVLSLDFLKSPIRHEKEITSAVGIPILGHIPKI